YTALENGGNMLNPSIVQRTFTVEGEDEAETTVDEPGTTVFREAAMSERAIEIEKPALRRVMIDGTGYNALLGNKFNIYGKTGTAQVGENQSREVNWVIALNEDDGKLYLVAVETNAGEGTVPKLGILRGMVDEESYNEALTTVDRNAQAKAEAGNEG
ncbi:MAG: penicillin-binding transpeptidase domain-containing protein, partial [Christensenella sp.]